MLLFQSNWDAVLKESASKVFGHRTANSLNYVFQAKDFHKSFQLVSAFTEAGVKVVFTIVFIMFCCEVCHLFCENGLGFLSDFSCLL